MSSSSVKLTTMAKIEIDELHAEIAAALVEASAHEADDVGEFGTACPHCGHVINIRLYATATSEVAEND